LVLQQRRHGQYQRRHHPPLRSVTPSAGLTTTTSPAISWNATRCSAWVLSRTSGRSFLEPVRVVGLEGIVSMSSYFGHGCAGLHDGAVWCWGANERGQLGDGTTEPSLVPVQAVLPP
jgi:alpha-tubulin suppressor-like RCC1 family protein